MDFNVRNFWVITIGGVDVWITETIVNTWIIMLILIVLAIVVRIKLNAFQDSPTGFQNIIELIVESFESFVHNAVGPKLQWMGNWFFSVFIFVLVSNLSGVFGPRPPTADWITPAALALVTFVLTHVLGVKYRGGQYLKGFIEPHPLFLPLNIMGELSKPISLSFRLFGNLLAGVILMALVYGLFPLPLRFFIPMPLHAFFDIAMGVLQTYVFCILSLTFISTAALENE